MEQTTLGKIEVLPTAIASLASQVVLECYGVAGMATKDLTSGIVEIIATVARNIQSVVKYTVEKALGVPVVAVNVHVQDLRISSE
jgi:uncharacterized alkaline shock family protein YloU